MKTEVKPVRNRMILLSPRNEVAPLSPRETKPVKIAVPRAIRQMLNRKKDTEKLKPMPPVLTDHLIGE